MQMQLEDEGQQVQVWLRALPDIRCPRIRSVEGRLNLDPSAPRVAGLRRAGVEQHSEDGHAVLGATFAPSARGPLRCSVNVSEPGAAIASEFSEKSMLSGLSDEQAELVLDTVLSHGAALGPGRLEIALGGVGENSNEYLESVCRSLLGLLRLDAAASTGSLRAEPDRALVAEAVFPA